MPWIEPEIVASVVADIQNQKKHNQNGSLRLESELAVEKPTESE
jgi:hypothetical protein